MLRPHFVTAKAVLSSSVRDAGNIKFPERLGMTARVVIVANILISFIPGISMTSIQIAFLFMTKRQRILNNVNNPRAPVPASSNAPLTVAAQILWPMTKGPTVVTLDSSSGGIVRASLQTVD